MSADASGRGPAPGGSPLQLLAVAASSATAGAIVTASVFTAWVQRMTPPKLHFTPTEENLELLRAIPMLSRTYVPNLLAWNAHLAGFFGYVKLSGKDPVASVERVTLPDGGNVALSWSGSAADGETVVLLLPGINNDARMGYIRHLMRLVQDEQIGHAVAVDWRGLGGLELTAVSDTPRPYCAAMSSDVAAIIAHLRVRLPASPIFAVGWSLGGGLLLRHLGELGERCLLSGGVAVSPGVDVRANMAKLTSTWTGRAYIGLIMGPLTHYFWRHRAAFARGPRGLSFARDVLGAFGHPAGFDDRLYGPLWGHAGKEAYWDACDANALLEHIKVPTIVVHSEDDPICPVGSIALDKITANPNLLCAVTRHGGHMGHTAGLSPLKEAWTDRLVLHFVKHLVGRSDTGHTRAATRSSGGASGSASAAAGFPVFAGTHSRL